MLHQCFDFFGRGPDVAQPAVAGLALAHRFGHQGARDGAGQRVGHDQRGRGQEVGLDVRVDARFEVAVARQHGRADEIVAGDGFVQVRRQVARVADAGGAAVGGHVEAQLFQVGQEARLGQVGGDDARSGGKRGLDVLGHLQAGFHGLLGQQAGGQQHVRVRRVGAGRDGGDQDVAILDLGAGAGREGR
ncbi:hypothetical protein G6F57_019816 [Rhizopus arrhizus]|nr:hypothetical protein G6F57_019816 [Rhizopus arrhizus]